MTWRRLGVLVAHLPRESATFAALHPDMAPWGIAEQLLATVADLVAVGNWQFASVNAKKGAAGDAPDPIERPGVKPKRRCRTSLAPEEIHARLLAQRNGGGD